MTPAPSTDWAEREEMLWEKQARGMMGNELIRPIFIDKFIEFMHSTRASEREKEYARGRSDAVDYIKEHGYETGQPELVGWIIKGEVLEAARKGGDITKGD